MRTIYIDCGMGAAGDMLTAALIELTDNKEETVKELNALNIPTVEYILEESVKCGIKGSHMHVKVNGVEEDEHMHDHHSHEHEHEHHEHHHDHEHDGHEHHHEHHGMHDIEHIVSHINVSDKIKKDILSVYNLIAEAESDAHGCPISEIHFHEVGSMDAIADVTAVCFLMDKLNVEKVVASLVHVGAGTVKCAHGILPVPAPATAYILRNVPIYGGEIKSELCTPTGAALLKHFVSEFGNMPVMTTDRIGYGMGKKDFERANCVRVMLGDAK
ncbi:MAG: LarC family nickel insertion protein [Lachnospiraceae bacterium]|nr:LarC family nickel insertion protein [Lachnospiraceae bacterium]